MATFTKASTRRVKVACSSIAATADHTVTDKSYVVPITRSRTGQALPQWLQYVKDEKNATTPLTAYEQTFKVDSGLTRVQFKKDKKFGEWIGSGWVTGFTNFPSTDVSVLKREAEAQAVTALNSKLRKMQTPFEGAVFTGELKETIQLLRNPFGSVVKLTDAFVAKSKKYREITKASANQWLELQYAILPLISDTIQIIDLINGAANVRDKSTLRVYGESQAQTVSQIYQAQPMGVNGLSGTLDHRRTVTVQNVIRCGLTTAFIEGLSYRSDWLKDSFDDLSSIPITLYELTMYSFLIDYFVNIGDIIEGAVSSRSALSYTSNSTIITTEDTRILGTAVITRPDLIGSLVLFGPTTVTSTLREVTRGAAASTIPPMVFTLPGTKIRYANIAALIAARGIK